MTSLLVHAQAVTAHGMTHVVPLVTPASMMTLQGFVRVVNRSNRAGTVRIYAIDDTGERFGPVSLSLNAKATVHFNSRELERGNTSKGLSGGVGDGEGHWRLEMHSDLDIEPLAYIRTGTGFLTSMHDVAAEDATGRYRVPIFNPGSNRTQQSRLRLINPGENDVKVTITGLDDEGMPPPRGDVHLMLPAGGARMITAQQLESGDASLDGRFGDGSGKWTLFVSANQPVQVMSLLSSDGNLTNLSRTPYIPHGAATTGCLVVAGTDGDNGSFIAAHPLGDLTTEDTVLARTGTIGTYNADNWYSFTMSGEGTTRDTSSMRFVLRNLTQNANLYLYNSDNQLLSYCNGGGRYSYCRSENPGTDRETLVRNFGEGTYYIRVHTVADAPVSYQLRYSNDSEVPGRSLASAIDLGDLTNVADVRSLEGRVHTTGNDNCLFYQNYYRFTLDQDLSLIQAELRNLTQNANLDLLDSDGHLLSYCNGGGRYSYCRSENPGTDRETLVRSFGEGTYYIRVHTVADAPVSYQLRYGLSGR